MNGGFSSTSEIQSSKSHSLIYFSDFTNYIPPHFFVPSSLLTPPALFHIHLLLFSSLCLTDYSYKFNGGEFKQAQCVCVLHPVQM